MKKNKMFIVLLCVLITLISVIVILSINLKTKTTFSKPKFDKSSSVKIPDNLNYNDSVLKVSDGYTFYIEALPKIKKDHLIVNFISLENNNIWIKVRVLNSKEEVVAESGLVKPGEFLNKIKLNKSISSGDDISYVIMGYEKDTYFSAGVVNLNTKVGE